MLDHQDPNAVEWARQHVAEMLSRNADGGKLVESTRGMIREAITTALENHDSDDAIADMLRDAYAFSEQRAELIARTEVGNALGAGSFIGAQAVGMDEKHWLLSNDEGVCPRCQSNADEGWIPIGKDFASGDKYPLAHPHCRCDAAYRRKPKED
jgi:SPP1 gp7 family putative phage head morphogenesis protein